MPLSYAGKASENGNDFILFDCTTWCGWSQKHTTERLKARREQWLSKSGKRQHIVCEAGDEHPSATVACSCDGFADLAKRFKWLRPNKETPHA